MAFKTATNEVSKNLGLGFDLREEQLAAMQAICEKNHTFCLLPTGYGKSVIFTLTPLIMDQVSLNV